MQLLNTYQEPTISKTSCADVYTHTKTNYSYYCFSYNRGAVEGTAPLTFFLSCIKQRELIKVKR